MRTRLPRSAYRVGITALALLAFTACSDSDSNRRTPPPEEPTVAVSYDSTASPPELPFPNAIYENDEGRLTLPLPDDAEAEDLGNVVVALNTLDGFSTITPIHIDFAEPIDETSIESGSNVRLFEISLNEDGLPDTVIEELNAAENYSVTISAVKDTRILIKPLVPLHSGAHYLVSITSGLNASNGLAMGPSDDYVQLREGEGSDTGNGIDRGRLAELVRTQEQVLADSGVQPDTIVTSFSFSTQNSTEVMQGINDNATPMPVTLERPMMTIAGEVLPLTTAPFAPLAAFYGLTPSGQSDLYTGTITLPYYMNLPSSPADDSVLDSYMADSDGAPISGSDETPQSVNVIAPLLLSIPNPSRDPLLLKPASGWPVAIYHHGIFFNRTNMLLIADALAAQGVAMIAIDHPMHGVTPNDATILPLNIFAAVGVSFYDADTERHFNLDLDQDGEIDGAGDHFSSSRNQLTNRDNLRQSVSDLIHLARSIPSIMLPDASDLTFDRERIHFVGQSLGSFAGTILAGVNEDIVAFSLAVPGSGGAKGQEGSPSFSTGLVEGLASLGLEQGSQEYEDYLTALITINGAADPLNYAEQAGLKHSIHLTEIIGDSTPDNPPDQTVPNTVLNAGQYEGLVVETAPLAGTEALVRSMGLEALLASQVDPEGLLIVARYTQGGHSSQVNPSTIADPFAVPAVTVEIQLQTATFIANDGKSVEVNNSELLEMNYLPPE
ncbi:MAG: hypothetical protein ABJK25_06025 [Halieaceae bacterium]